MIAEAVDTLVTLGWALLAWIVIAALAVTLALYTAAAAVWGACRTARAVWARARGHTPAESPRRPADTLHAIPDAPEPADDHTRPQPRWTRKDAA